MKLQGYWKTTSTHKLKDNNTESHRLDFHSPPLKRYVSGKKCRLSGKEGKKKEKKKTTFLCVLQEPGYIPASDTEGTLSVRAKFTVFPFPLSGFILASARELLSSVSVSVCLGDEPTTANRMSGKKWEKHLQGGQSIAPLSLKGPRGHILRRPEGEYSCVYSICIPSVFHWMEMAD